MLSLPLAKLSSTQDVHPDDPKLTWKHESHDLHFVIDSYQAGGSARQLLKVVQGTQVREQIELERLILEGNEIIQTMQERGVELKNDQLPINAIVRCPLLAIRWKLPNQKVRRLQFRFKSSEHYDTVYHYLYQLGLRMSSSEVKERVQTPGPGQHQRAEVGGPSCSPSRLAEIHSRPYTATSAPTALESQIQEHAHRRPSSAFAGPSNEGRSGFPSPSNPLTPPTYLQRPDSATSMLDYPSSSAFSSSGRFVPTNEDDPRERTMSPDTSTHSRRPGSTEGLLPPRRELPFQRSSLPRSSGSDTARPSSRPSTGLMGPPPLPARVAILRPNSAQASFQDTELPPLPQPTVVDQRSPRTPTPDAGAFMRATTAIFEEADMPLSSSSSSSSPLPHNRSSTSFSSTFPSSDDAHRDHNTFNVAPPANKATDSLASYAMQSNDQRRAALNEFIFRHLDSDEFLTLVEDMETCWARVALGM